MKNTNNDPLTAFFEQYSDEIMKAVNVIAPKLAEAFNKGGHIGAFEFAAEYIDAVNEQSKINEKVSCKEGCSACCYSVVELTGIEAIYIREIVEHKRIKIDQNALYTQVKEEESSLTFEERKCVLLGEDNKCSIYESRPLICRLWNSASDPKECVPDSDGVINTKTLRTLNSWAMLVALSLLSIQLNGGDSTVDMANAIAMTPME